MDLGTKLRGGFDRPPARGAAQFDGAGGRGSRAREVSSVHERVVIVARVVRTHGSIFNIELGRAGVASSAPDRVDFDRDLCQVSIFLNLILKSESWFYKFSQLVRFSRALAGTSIAPPNTPPPCPERG